MTLTVSILQGGVNSHETVSEEVNFHATDFFTEGVVGAITNTSGVAPATGAFAVNAQGTPDMTVAVTAGAAYVTATPTSGNSQLLRVKNSASENVTIAANSTGGTRYDWVYIKIDADKAKDPAVDASDVATLVTSRSTSATTDNGTPPTYGYPIAVVTVANGAVSITNGNIADARTLANGGYLNTIRYYTGSSTWTKPAGLKFVIVEVVGGGGGGGGAAAPAAGNCAAGAGGGGGGYAREKIAAASLGATETVTVGAAGTAGSAGANNGGAGGTTSFGSHLQATGGALGVGGSASTITGPNGEGGTAGVGSGGDLNLDGSDGGPSTYFTTRARGGGGGASLYSGYTKEPVAGSGGQTTGGTGSNYGGGGAGGASGAGGSAAAGGAGAAGLVIVHEYF